MAETVDKKIVSAVARAMYRIENPTVDGEKSSSGEDFQASKKDYAKKAQQLIRRMEAQKVTLTISE